MRGPQRVLDRGELTLMATTSERPSDDLCGVILAGGMATRLYPLTKPLNKHLLPIGGCPMVFHAVEALVASGISDVLLITGGRHAGGFVELLGDGRASGLRLLEYMYQERPEGIAAALAMARGFAAGRAVVVMLADNVFEYSIAGPIGAFRRAQTGARVLLSELDDVDALRQLGVAEFDAQGRITRIVEKPEFPPSSYAVTGVYCYENSVFDLIPGLEVSPTSNEFEITEINNRFIEQGSLEHEIVEGFWGDAGQSIESYYRVCDFVRMYGCNKTLASQPGSSARALALPSSSAPIGDVDGNDEAGLSELP